MKLSMKLRSSYFSAAAWCLYLYFVFTSKIIWFDCIDGGIYFNQLLRICSMSKEWSNTCQWVIRSVHTDSMITRMNVISVSFSCPSSLA